MKIFTLFGLCMIPFGAYKKLSAYDKNNFVLEARVAPLKKNLQKQPGENISNQDIDKNLCFSFTLQEGKLYDKELLHANKKYKASYDEMKEDLIEQALKRQFTSHFIKLDWDKVDEYIAEVEKDMGLIPGTLREYCRMLNISYEFFRNKISAEIAWKEYIKFLVKTDYKFILNPQELKAYYSALSQKQCSNHYRMGVIRIMAGPGAQKKIMGIYGKILEGKPFDLLVEQYCPAEKESMFSWKAQDDLTPDEARIVTRMRAGSVCEPRLVSDDKGRACWVIIALLDKQPGRVILPQLPSEDVIRSLLLSRHMEKVSQHVMKKIRSQYGRFIKKNKTAYTP